MTTFDLHIIRRLLTGFLFLLAVLIVFYIVLHYVEFIDDFMDRGASQRDVFLVYYPNLVPEIVRLTTPLALFLTCVYLTGRLAQEFQILALQTSGVSLYRLMVPFTLVGVILTAAIFAFSGWIVPVTNDTVLDFEQQYLKDAPRQLDITD
ncbi:MAG TPA: LptF/LptG family permease, partial [Rhodothermales bacterium]